MGTIPDSSKSTSEKTNHGSQSNDRTDTIAKHRLVNRTGCYYSPEAETDDCSFCLAGIPAPDDRTRALARYGGSQSRNGSGGMH